MADKILSYTNSTGVHIGTAASPVNSAYIDTLNITEANLKSVNGVSLIGEGDISTEVTAAIVEQDEAVTEYASGLTIDNIAYGLQERYEEITLTTDDEATLLEMGHISFKVSDPATLATSPVIKVFFAEDTTKDKPILLRRAYIDAEYSHYTGIAEMTSILTASGETEVFWDLALASGNTTAEITTCTLNAITTGDTFISSGSNIKSLTIGGISYNLRSDLTTTAVLEISITDSQYESYLASGSSTSTGLSLTGIDLSAAKTASEIRISTPTYGLVADLWFSYMRRTLVSSDSGDYYQNRRFFVSSGMSIDGVEKLSYRYGYFSYKDGDTSTVSFTLNVTSESWRVTTATSKTVNDVRYLYNLGIADVDYRLHEITATPVSDTDNTLSSLEVDGTTYSMPDVITSQTITIADSDWTSMVLGNSIDIADTIDTTVDQILITTESGNINYILKKVSDITVLTINTIIYLGAVDASTAVILSVSGSSAKLTRDFNYVAANPDVSSQTTTELTYLRVGRRYYSIPAGSGSGTTVTANPEETTQTLTGIGIGGTNYAVNGVKTFSATLTSAEWLSLTAGGTASITADFDEEYDKLEITNPDGDIYVFWREGMSSAYPTYKFISTSADGYIYLYVATFILGLSSLRFDYSRYRQISAVNPSSTTAALTGLTIGGVSYSLPTGETAKITNADSEVSLQLQPNVFYDFTGSLTSLTLTLAEASSEVEAEYKGQFYIGDTIPTISLPECLWVTDPTYLTNRTYQFSIMNGIGIICSVEGSVTE